MNEPVQKRLLLMGNPNVGKSVFFSRLTGTQVIASNYPGSTVEYTRGYAIVNGEKYEVIDVPGTYALCPTSKAEEVACKMLQDASPENDIVINVVDSTNLERNLDLTLQLMEKDLPVIVALNIWDDAKHKGIHIDHKALEEWLGTPAIPTTAVTGQGFRTLIQRLSQAKRKKVRVHSLEDRWKDIGRLVGRIQKIEHRHHTVPEVLEDLSIHPFFGLVIAGFAAFFSFSFIRLMAETLIAHVFDPFFDNIYAPVLMKLSASLYGIPFLHNILVGKLFDGQIDYLQSFGVLSTGVYVELAMVLPYVFSFYLVLGLLEDSGYLPRLAVMLDNLMHKVGLHGFAIVPTLLAFGCNVPGILATRVLDSKRERFIASTLISIGIPCAALQAMIIGVLGSYGAWPIVIVYLFLFLSWVILGTLLNRLVKGFSPELLLEIPPYRMPPLRMFYLKIKWRIKQFLWEAAPIVLAGVFAVNIMYSLGLFDIIASAAAPLVTGLWGLPKEAVSSIAIGFLRKDVAVGMLAPLGLTVKQLIISCVVLSMFFPCIATFTVLLKELGFKAMIASTAIMVITSVAAGTLLNMIL